MASPWNWRQSSTTSAVLPPAPESPPSHKAREPEMTDKLIDSGPVLLDLDSDGIARLRLNRPEAANGLNVELLEALHAAIMRVHGEPRTRVVILSGEGS